MELIVAATAVIIAAVMTYVAYGLRERDRETRAEVGRLRSESLRTLDAGRGETAEQDRRVQQIEIAHGVLRGTIEQQQTAVTEMRHSLNERLSTMRVSFDEALYRLVGAISHPESRRIFPGSVRAEDKKNKSYVMARLLVYVEALGATMIGAVSAGGSWQVWFYLVFDDGFEAMHARLTDALAATADSNPEPDADGPLRSLLRALAGDPAIFLQVGPLLAAKSNREFRAKVVDMSDMDRIAAANVRGDPEEALRRIDATDADAFELSRLIPATSNTEPAPRRQYWDIDLLNLDPPTPDRPALPPSHE